MSGTELDRPDPKEATMMDSLIEDQHTYYRVVTDPKTRHVRAVCACGWQSPMFTSAGLAGTAWDEHRAAVTR